MPKGGARIGAGRKPGPQIPKPLNLNNPAMAELAAMEMRARQANPRLQEGRDLLSQAANLCFGIVARCQKAPADDVTGLPIDGNVRKAFWEALHKGSQYAHWVAAFQSPTYRAVFVAPPPDQGQPGDNARIVNLKVFDAIGKAVVDEVQKAALR